VESLLVVHTQAIELLLGAFEILSPQQSGDVYLAVLHYLITTVRTQASRPPHHLNTSQPLQEWPRNDMRRT
jgi:hypothetical protein